MWGALFPAFIAGVAYVYDVGPFVFVTRRCRVEGEANFVGKIRLGRETKGFEPDSGPACSCY